MKKTKESVWFFTSFDNIKKCQQLVSIIYCPCDMLLFLFYHFVIFYFFIVNWAVTCANFECLQETKWEVSTRFFQRPQTSMCHQTLNNYSENSYYMFMKNLMWGGGEKNFCLEWRSFPFWEKLSEAEIPYARV